VKSFRNIQGDHYSTRKLARIVVVMSAGSALLTEHTGISVTLNNVKETDILWDFFRNCYVNSAWKGTGIAPGLEPMQREELDLYLKKYEEGFNPSTLKDVTFTVLKTGVYMERESLLGQILIHTQPRSLLKILAWRLTAERPCS